MNLALYNRICPWLSLQFHSRLRTNWWNLTKCICIDVDQIYVGIVARLFSQFFNMVIALGCCQNFPFTHYLVNELMEFWSNFAYALTLIRSRLGMFCLIFYAPIFEEVEGAYCFRPVHPSFCPSGTLAYGHEWLELGSWNFIHSISMKNKQTCIFSSPKPEAHKVTLWYTNGSSSIHTFKHLLLRNHWTN